MIQIQIEWYNLFAILIGIYFIVEIIIAEKNKTQNGYFPDLTSMLYLIGAIIFYAIFGGIFWW